MKEKGLNKKIYMIEKRNEKIKTLKKKVQTEKDKEGNTKI